MAAKHDKQPRTGPKAPRALVRAKRERITSQLNLLSTEELKAIVAEDLKDLRRNVALNLLRERSSLPTSRQRKKLRRRKRKEFLSATPNAVADLDDAQLPSSSKKYLKQWLSRFDDSQLMSLQREAKSDSVRDAAQSLLMSRTERRQKQSFISKFRQFSIEELLEIVDQQEDGFEIAKSILKQKLHKSLASLTTEELKQISQKHGQPIISQIAREIYSSRRPAPGMGLDWWREQD